MKIEELLRNLELPRKYYNSNFDMSEKYAEEANIFIDSLKCIDGAEFKNVNKENQIKEEFAALVSAAEKNTKKILNVLKYYQGADLKKAQEEFDSLLEFLQPYLFWATIDDRVSVEYETKKVWTSFRTTRGHVFFRVRGVKEKTDRIQNNPDELFHIPLSKRNLTNNERFSIAGFPSLYLSTMLPLAWQESGYPQKYYYSEYQYLKLDGRDRNFDDEFVFLALYSPREICNWGIAEKHNNFELWLTVVVKCLMMYPLVMACSFVNHSGKGAYKQEYVVPQMLMQWVLRNKEIVQGISYFTCVDISMMPSEYCAYNVVIPAMKPYDIKKYSQRLRDEFTWTKPQYFELPLLDAEENKDDRKAIYQFIDRIRKTYRMGLPDTFREYFHEIERVCICLYHLMLSGSDSDIQMIVHTLNLMNVSYLQIKKQSIEELIKVAKEKNTFLTSDAFAKCAEELRMISHEFLMEDYKTDCIGTIIDRYRNTIWNDYHHDSVIDIAIREGESTNTIEKWCHEHNLIYRKHILNDQDSEALGKALNDIITPVIFRRGSVSIYDKKEYEPVDYFKENFDPNIYGKDLL